MVLRNRLEKKYLLYTHIWQPTFRSCATFLDLDYCHHILAINRLNLAIIILDPTTIISDEPKRRLVGSQKEGDPQIC